MLCSVGGPNALSAKGTPEARGFEPSWRVSPPTEFPDRRSGVQGEAPTGTPYSDSKRLGHHEAGEGTRVGSALGLDFPAEWAGWSAIPSSGDITLVWTRVLTRGRVAEPGTGSPSHLGAHLRHAPESLGPRSVLVTCIRHAGNRCHSQVVDVQCSCRPR